MKQQTTPRALTLAILYTAGKNPNMPAHARRLLAQKFGIDALEIELEAECQRLAAEALSELAPLARSAQ